MKRFLVALTTAFVAIPAFAQEKVVETTTHASGMLAIGAGLILGLAGLGAALGQGKAAASALEGIARNPAAADKIQTPLLLSLAFMEAIAIYAFAVAIMLTLKI